MVNATVSIICIETSNKLDVTEVPWRWWWWCSAVLDLTPFAPLLFEALAFVRFLLLYSSIFNENRARTLPMGNKDSSTLSDWVLVSVLVSFRVQHTKDEDTGTIECISSLNVSVCVLYISLVHFNRTCASDNGADR